MDDLEEKLECTPTVIQDHTSYIKSKTEDFAKVGIDIGDVKHFYRIDAYSSKCKNNCKNVYRYGCDYYCDRDLSKYLPKNLKSWKL